MFEKTRSCAIKKRYRTYTAAEKSLKGLVRHMREKDVHVYSCRYCQQFHIGHISHKGKGVKHV